jgi:hypothetical protein
MSAFFPKPGAARQGTVQNVAVSGSSATSANGFGSQTYLVRLSATTACFYLVSENANVVAATASNGSLLPANWVETIQVSPGEKISVIQSTAAGSLNVTELS